MKIVYLHAIIMVAALMTSEKAEQKNIHFGITSVAEVRNIIKEATMDLISYISATNTAFGIFTLSRSYFRLLLLHCCPLRT